jgi:methylenetetrahydrofolate dehydrogenase (NADP+)/methenyltetrahydrofolate cyclohydrolase
MVGKDPVSEVSVRNKIKACRQVGINPVTIKLDRSVSTIDILFEIEKLNNRSDIHGIQVELPLPPKFDLRILLESISSEKDIDRFHQINVGDPLEKEGLITPPTAGAFLEIIKSENIPLRGKKVTIVSDREIVIEPLSLIFLTEQAIQTICHSNSSNLELYTKKADILVVDAGIPNLIKENMVKERVVVIDLGFNKITADCANSQLLRRRKDDFKKQGVTFIGDVDFLNVRSKADYITPVPGGIGPIIFAMTLSNCLRLAKNLVKKEEEMKNFYSMSHL